MNLETYLQKRYTPQTAKAYQREIESYLQNYPTASKALHADIVNYLGQLRQRYYNARTISRILSSIKAYYDFLSYTGKRKDNPAKSIRLRDKQSRDIQLQDLFTPEELESLLNRKERYNPLEYRNKVLMSFLIYQAVLPRELAGITTDDINLEQGTVYIKATTKTNARTLQLKPNQIMLLYHYIHEVRPKLLKKIQNQETEKTLLISHRGNPETVSSLVSHVKRMKHKFTGRTLNMQTIRQSVITNLLKAGNDLRIVQVFAGHKYPSTTEKYKQTNVEALQSAINQHHPIR
jgi:integrase/recombinase XerD